MMSQLSPKTLTGGKSRRANRRNKASRKNKSNRRSRRTVRKGGELITSGVATSAILLLANNNSNRIFPMTRSATRKFSIRSK